MNGQCSILDQANLEMAMQKMHKTFGDDFMQLFGQCPISGGKKRRLKGGIRINPRYIKYGIYLIITFLFAANLYQSKEMIQIGIEQIADGTCNSAFTRWSYIQHPLCTFYIGYVDAITQALRGNIAVISGFATIITAILQTPGRINAIIEPFSEQVARIINGSDVPMLTDEQTAAQGLLALRQGPYGGRKNRVRKTKKRTAKKQTTKQRKGGKRGKKSSRRR